MVKSREEADCVDGNFTLDFGAAAFGLQASLTTLSKLDMSEDKCM